MKYYFISGERSGDLHASNLISSLKEADSEAVFRGMGGDLSVESGLSLVVHFEEVAVMGFLEVVIGIQKVFKYLSLIKNDILQFHPDVLILVDYGGFNMKIARFAKTHGIPVHYYIPPKVWAWNQNRAFKLKEITDHIYSILPFEKDFYKKYDLPVHYVGNPLLDEISKFQVHPYFHQKNELSYKPIIALLPGSRKQELDNMLEIMLKLVPKFPDAQFVIAGVSNLKISMYAPAVKSGLRIVFDQTYDLLKNSTAAVVTSGTATLETALFKVPQVVVYKTSAVSYSIAKFLIKVPYISLVNLIAEKEVVKELIQGSFNLQNALKELQLILGDDAYRKKILEGYDDVIEKIGNQSASKNTATLIFNSIDKKTMDYTS